MSAVVDDGIAANRCGTSLVRAELKHCDYKVTVHGDALWTLCGGKQFLIPRLSLSWPMPVDDAWDRLRRSGSECVRPAYARVMREVVARRIIEMAQRGTRDPQKLAEGALRFLATNYRMDPKQKERTSRRGHHARCSDKA